MPPWHVQENKWRAARYGLDADRSSSTPRPTSGWSPTTWPTCSSGWRRSPSGSAARPSCAVGRRHPAAGARRTSASAPVAASTGGDLVAVVDSVVRELREHSADASSTRRAPGRSSRGVRRAAGPPGRARPGRAATRRRRPAPPGRWSAAGRVRLRVRVMNGRNRILIPTRAAGRPSRSMSSTTRAGQRADRLLDVGPVVEVLLERLLAPVRARHPRRRVDRARVGSPPEPVEPRTHRRSDPLGEQPRVGTRQLVDRVDAERSQLLGRLASRLPTARRSAGPPSPRTSCPPSAARSRAACRSRSRSWRAACCPRCRPSSAAGWRRAPPP